MIRPIALLLVVSLQEVGSAAGADIGIARPATDIVCASHAPRGERLELDCPLTVSGAPQRFRFQANFSGGHDDSMVSMAATLNGAPVVCDKGSRSSLVGDNGDVSIDCRFSITEKAGTTLALKVKLLWRYAQYTNFDFHPD